MHLYLPSIPYLLILNIINDNLEQQMHLIFEDMMAKATNNKIKGEFIVAKSLTQVITGKEDANFSVSNGKYKFFTCSNTPLHCDEYAFNSSSVLIAGNGDFNVKHYSGKFNAYQRTYVLSPQKEYYAILYLAALYRINSFKTGSSGSIVKFITKSDVENIPVFMPHDSKYLDELNKLVIMQEQNMLENELLVQLRDWLLPMLMNGQATISD
jgi:type I restriction enzyme ecoDI specificity protein